MLYQRQASKSLPRFGAGGRFRIIITKIYGAYSVPIKNVMDRTIGAPPLSTFRGWEMHHVLRYKKHRLMKVLVYGDITDKEKETFTYMVKRNALNDGYKETEVLFTSQKKRRLMKTLFINCSPKIL